VRKTSFFARGKASATARPPSVGEILDSSNELIEDTPEPSPAVPSKPTSKVPQVFSKAKYLSDSGISDGVVSKNTSPEELKARQWGDRHGSGKVSDSSNIIGASDSDSDDDDVPLAATKKHTKANVISSDSEDFEDTGGQSRFQTFSAQNKEESIILTDDDSDSFVTSKVISSDEEENSRDDSRAIEPEPKGSNGISHNRGATPKTASSIRTASDSIVWSEPRKNKKNMIESDSESEEESGEESDDSGEEFVSSERKKEKMTKVPSPQSSSDESSESDDDVPLVANKKHTNLDESSDDDFQPPVKNLNKKMIDSDDSSGDDFKLSKTKEIPSKTKETSLRKDVESLRVTKPPSLNTNNIQLVGLGQAKAKISNPPKPFQISPEKPKNQANVDEVIDLVDSDSDVEPIFIAKPQRAPTIPRVNSNSKVGMVASPEDVREIEQQIQKLAGVIKQNKYDAANARLPDGGARLREVVQQDTQKLMRLQKLRELLVTKRNSQEKSGDVMANPPFKQTSISDSFKPIDNRPVMGASATAAAPQNMGVMQSELAAARRKLGVLRGAAATARSMPDGGKQLFLKIKEAEEDVNKKEAKILMMNRGVTQQPSASNLVNQAWQAQRMDLQGFGMSAEQQAKMLGEYGQNNMYGGRMNQVRRQEVRSVTMEALKAMHTSLETMPSEGNMEDQPLSLRSSVQLFPHQRQALSWLLWRETQHPAGGILADDMGLGKTLTMISLILKHRELQAEVDRARMERGEESKENEWNGKGSDLVKSKTTLIVCPASLLGQWEKEVENRVKSGRLRVLVYHGNNRKCSAKALARYDLVITTYGTVQSEVKSVLGDKADKDAKTKMDDLVAAEDMNTTKGQSELLGVAWERIILDEAHQIRNPRSLTSQSVCRLRAERRWCLTGTPIQNKELDMYALVRFIRCSPFDEYRVWKVWIDNKSAQGQQRMNTLVRSLMLRRTKETKSQATGKAIVDLPQKFKTEHKIELTPEERKVYLEVFSFSQAALKKYMDQNEEKQEMKEMGFSGSGAAARTKTSTEDFSYRPGAGSEMEQPENVKAHHILVLLLRLRQICCHPGLIKSMLDTETKATEGLQDDDGEELDLISAMEDMSVGKNKPQQKILDLSNPVFEDKRISSKIQTVIKELKELKIKGKETGVMEKTVIVSQWTSMLYIVKVHVEAIGLRCAEINGHVAVKTRGNIVDEFNKGGRGPEVMLLSLAAGGVGLNLVGANHLFLLDMHWNPQLEAQACDRIYRVGQKREVKIHRFVVKDSVEEKILLLQEKKLGLAQEVLTGAKRSGANKLSMDDLRMLFSVSS